MYKIRAALIQFMYGRNGVDQLNRALFWLYLGLWILQIVLTTAGLMNAPLRMVYDVLLWALVLLFFYRAFSKNLGRRREENQRWVNWLWRMKSGRQSAKERHADKAHKYFTCKNCKTICRVPVGKGKIIITCPKCGAQIHAKT